MSSRSSLMACKGPRRWITTTKKTWSMNHLTQIQMTATNNFQKNSNKKLHLRSMDWSKTTIIWMSTAIQRVTGNSICNSILNCLLTNSTMSSLRRMPIFHLRNWCPFTSAGILLQSRGILRQNPGSWIWCCQCRLFSSVGSGKHSRWFIGVRRRW